MYVKNSIKNDGVSSFPIPNELLFSIFLRLVEKEPNALLTLRRVCSQFNRYIKKNGKAILLRALSDNLSPPKEQHFHRALGLEAYYRLMIVLKKYDALGSLVSSVSKMNRQAEILKFFFKVYQEEKILIDQEACFSLILRSIYILTRVRLCLVEMHDSGDIDYAIFNYLQKKIKNDQLCDIERKLAFINLIRFLKRKSCRYVSKKEKFSFLFELPFSKDQKEDELKSYFINFIGSLIEDDHSGFKTRRIGIREEAFNSLNSKDETLDKLSLIKEIVSAVTEFPKLSKRVFSFFAYKCINEKDESGVTIQLHFLNTIVDRLSPASCLHYLNEDLLRALFRKLKVDVCTLCKNEQTFIPDEMSYFIDYFILEYAPHYLEKGLLALWNCYNGCKDDDIMLLNMLAYLPKLPLPVKHRELIRNIYLTGQKRSIFMTCEYAAAIKKTLKDFEITSTYKELFKHKS